jgi:hypothetical protein
MKNLFKTHWLRFKAQAELGMDVAFQGIWYSLLLFMLFVVVMQMGQVVYQVSGVYNAARAAVQEGAKEIDRGKFVNENLVELAPAAAIDTALDTFDTVAGELDADATVSADTIRGQRVLHMQVELPIQFTILNSMFGDTVIPDITTTIDVYAEPTFGISQENQ